MGYAQLYIWWLNKAGMLKSPGRDDFTLVAILNANEYSTGVR